MRYYALSFLFSCVNLSSLFAAGASHWTKDGNGNWNDGANWDPPGVPASAPGVIVYIDNNTSSLSGPVTITIDTISDPILGILHIDNHTLLPPTTLYTIQQGSSGLQLDNGPSTPALIDQPYTNNSNNVISANLKIIHDLELFNQSSKSLELSGSILAPTSYSITNSGPGSGEVILSGTVSSGGLSALIQNSSSTLVITGSNSFTGTTALSNGILLVRNNAALGSSTLVLSNGTFAASGIAPRTLTNPITVSGPVQLGQSSVNTGDLTFSGLIDLNNDVRVISIETPLPLGSVTFSNTISNGGLTKAGSGTLNISGTNTYQGPTTITSGSLSLYQTDCLSQSSGVTLSSSGILELYASQSIKSLNGESGTSIFIDDPLVMTLGAGNGSDAFSGQIIGSGSVIKVGSGTQFLSGSNSYTGGTTISEGTLSVSNPQSLGTGPVSLTQNAILDLGLTNLESISSYTQNGTSTLQVAIEGTRCGSITTAGAAAITADNTLSLIVSGDVPQQGEYTIIRGGSSGNIVAPNIAVSGISGFSFSVIETGNNLVLRMTKNAIPTNFAAYARNTNARAVGVTLDQITNPSADMTYVLNTLEQLSPDQVNAALNTLYPQIDGGILQVAATQLNGYIASVLDRIEHIRSQSEKNALIAAIGDIPSPRSAALKDDLWVRAYGSFLEQGTRQEIRGYDAWNAGGLLGWDHLFTSGMIGLSGGYAYSQVDSDTVNKEQTDINSAQATLYGGYSRPSAPLFVDLLGYFAYNWYSSQRAIDIGEIIQRTARADYHGLQYGAYFGSGYTIAFRKFEYTSLFSIQWDHLTLSHYTEHNADSLNLTVNKKEYDRVQTGLGARFSSSRKYGWGLFTRELHARWFYDFTPSRMAVTSTFTGGGAAFPTRGVRPARNSGNIGMMLLFDVYKQFSLFTTADVEIRSAYLGIYGSMTFKYAF